MTAVPPASAGRNPRGSAAGGMRVRRRRGWRVMQVYRTPQPLACEVPQPSSERRGKPWPDSMHAGRLGGAWDVEPARMRRLDLEPRGFRTCCASAACQPHADVERSAGAHGDCPRGRMAVWRRERDVPSGGSYAGCTGYTPPEERAHLCLPFLFFFPSRRIDDQHPARTPFDVGTTLYPLCGNSHPYPLPRRIDATPYTR
jgi:hypothetical protein